MSCLPSFYLAVELVIYLGPGGLVVREAVGRVVKLVCPDGVRDGLCEARGLVVVVHRVGEGNGGHGTDIGTQHAEQVNLLLRLRVGHVDDALVPARTAHVRQADARVARGPFDNGPASLDLPLGLGVLHDPARGTVLDGAAGVHELGLAVDRAARGCAQAVQAHERGLADRAHKAHLWLF